MIYEIIDTRTGERAKAYELVQEPWAKKTRGCDWPAFAIDEEGDVMLTDDCGNYDMVPEGRVEVRLVVDREKWEPCDYTAMRSAIDGEKEARQSLSETLRALEKSNARAEKAERERDALKARYRGGEPCEVCLHRDPNIADCNGDCLACSLDCLCNTCCEYSNWEYDEWRED